MYYSCMLTSLYFTVVLKDNVKSTKLLEYLTPLQVEVGGGRVSVVSVADVYLGIFM